MEARLPSVVIATAMSDRNVAIFRSCTNAKIAPGKIILCIFWGIYLLLFRNYFDMCFQSLLSLMSVEETTERLISILCEAATLKEPTTYKTGFWGRAQVWAYSLSVLC